MSAINETRTFTVACNRGIVEPCLGNVTIQHGHDSAVLDDDTVTSVATAERHLRARGWRLHTDDTASCPACIAAWEGHAEATSPPAFDDAEEA